MVISIFSSCKIEKNADSQLTTTESNIEHVCIPLTDAQIIGLYNTLTTVQTRAVVLVSSLEEFKSYLNTSLVAVCFTATWSGPCKMYKPIYHKVSENTLPVYVVSWKLMWMNLQNWQNYSILLKFLQLL